MYLTVVATMIKTLLSFTIILTSFKSNYAAEAPIIGILSQETYIINHLFPDKHYNSFIAASYVKFVESSGARAVPVWIGQNEDYYRNIINRTNGLLLPGGGTYFNETKGYGEAVRNLYKLAKEANDNKVHYPILGICLGMQALAFADANGVDPRVKCSAKNIVLPLNFEADYETSQLYSGAPTDIIDALKTKNLTYNFHGFCLNKEALSGAGILGNWRILSTNKDKKNFTFISSMESARYPFYGLEFHPEKNAFEFRSTLHFPKSAKAIEVARYFSDVFVKNSRKNANGYSSEEELERALIYNFNPIFTAPLNSSYNQLYVFKEEDIRI